MEWSGTPTVPQTDRFLVTEDDLRLSAWIDEHLKEKGDIGLAAWTYRCWTNDCEHHIYPVGGGYALALYGQSYRYRFLLPALEGNADDYERHVRDDFDAAWCLRNNIRYIYASSEGLEKNPGLTEAVEAGELRLLHREGKSCLYEVP
jgi:hypothetical protein